MKRCLMMLVCLGSSGCVAEAPQDEPAVVAKELTLILYPGGPLTPTGPNDFWIVTPSPEIANELWAARVDTKYSVVAEALRIKPGNVAEFNFQLGTTGGGYLKPVGPGSGPPPPPPVWPRYAVHAANRGIKVHDLALADTYGLQP